MSNFPTPWNKKCHTQLLKNLSFEVGWKISGPGDFELEIVTIFFSYTPPFFGHFDWPSQSHRIWSKSRGVMIGTVLESWRSILSENIDCINKFLIFDTYLEPERYISVVLALLTKILRVTVRVAKMPKNPKKFRNVKYGFSAF